MLPNSFKLINNQLLRAETPSCNSHILHYTKVPTFSDRRVATSCDTYKTPYVPIIPIPTKQLLHVFFTTIIRLFLVGKIFPPLAFRKSIHCLKDKKLIYKKMGQRSNIIENVLE